MNKNNYMYTQFSYLNKASINSKPIEGSSFITT